MIETTPSGTILHGRYRVERVLGSGGFGHVYLGVDLSANQQCALKEYLVSGASAQEQLQHEATVLSHLHHPHLPAFQDAFTERGRYYIVLNYIEGNDLTDIIRVARQRNEAVPITQIMNWLLAICDAVMFLHAQHPPVIHRDIKPDNIRITSNGMAILVDLGNAKAADGARTLFFIRHQGTPGYAPPEQYPGGTGTDARSDVYALGGTLYFALTAHEPPSVSTRNQAAQQGRADLPSLQEQLASNPPEVSHEANAVRQFRLGVTKPAKPAPRHSKHIAQLGSLSPEVLNLLNAIMQRAMAIKPRDRYQYVADLANDLKQVIKALPQPTPPPGSARTPDPNSTQPDLPMLYETIQQATKDKANQDGQGMQQASPPVSSASVATPPPSSPVVYRCPRCGTSTNQQAMFCPRCGTPLGDTTRNKAPNSAGDATRNKASNPAGDATSNKASNATNNARAISAEQTMIITPSARARAVQAGAAHTASPISNRPASPSQTSLPKARPAQSQQSQMHSPEARPARPPMNATASQPASMPNSSPAAQIPYQPTPDQMNASPSPFSWSKGMGALITFIIVLVIVVILIALLVIHHH